jgi:hypothetical protein
MGHRHRDRRRSGVRGDRGGAVERLHPQTRGPDRRHVPHCRGRGWGRGWSGRLSDFAPDDPRPGDRNRHNDRAGNDRGGGAAVDHTHDGANDNHVDDTDGDNDKDDNNDNDDHHDRRDRHDHHQGGSRL